MTTLHFQTSGPPYPSSRAIVNGRFLLARPTGVQRVARELVRALDDRISTMGNRRAWSVLAPKGAPSPELGAMTFQSTGIFGGQAWEQLDLPRLSQEALLVNLCNAAPLRAHRMLTMVHDAQVFTTAASYSPAFVAWYRFMLPRIGARSERVLTVSDFSRRQLARFGVAEFDRIDVVHNGVDHILRVRPDVSLLEEHGLIKRAYVLALGSPQKHKNLKVLFEAFANKAPSHLRLVLVGPWDAAAYGAAGLSLPDAAVLAGAVSDEKLCALIDQALCFASPSKTEGFGLPPLEAMCRGTPAIVTACGAFPEICGKGALYAEADEAESWRRAFSALRDDPVEWNRYVELGHAQAARFTWAAAADRVLGVLDKLAD